MRRFCKDCGTELLTDHIYDYDENFDFHTYKCPNCDNIITDDETIVTDYDIGDIVEYNGQEHTITDLFVSEYNDKIIVELDGKINTDTTEII